METYTTQANDKGGFTVRILHTPGGGVTTRDFATEREAKDWVAAQIAAQKRKDGES